MNNHKHTEVIQQKRDSELRQIDDTYIFNVSSGLYEPRTTARPPKQWIKNITATLGTLVSVFTLVLVGYTVYYARLQWKEANRGATASQEAAYAACVSAQISQRTLQEMVSGEGDTHNLAVGSIVQANAVTRAEAALIRIDSGAVGEYQSIFVLSRNLINVGQSAALNVKAEGESRIVKLGEEPSFSNAFPEYNTLRTGSISPAFGQADQAKNWQIVATDGSGQKILTNNPAFQKLQSFDAGGLYLSTWGRVTYQDIFGVSHWTQFCDHYPYPYKVATSFHFTKCAAYNKSDINTVPKVVQADSNKRPLQMVPEVVCSVPKHD